MPVDRRSHERRSSAVQVIRTPEGIQMAPRLQSAGTAGVAAGVGLAILFILFLSSGITPTSFNDPATMLSYIGTHHTQTMVTTIVSLVVVAFTIVFVAGLAAKLQAKTPTRATAVLYFGILAMMGVGLGALISGASSPAVAAYAAEDQVASLHAFVAVSALSVATSGFGNLFGGLSALMAGWAIITSQALGATLGWFGMIAGAIGILAFLFPHGQFGIHPLSILAPIVGLLWAGSALRKG